MFERVYKSRYYYIKAIQYDGTAEMLCDLMNEYLGIREYAGNLYIDDTDDTEIWPTDWLLIQDGMVKTIISDGYFDAIYTRITLDEFNANTPAKGIITDVDLRGIDKANEEKNNA